jgi:tol-pal system protein YbgF
MTTRTLIWAALAISLGAVSMPAGAADQNSQLSPADRAHMDALAQGLGDDNAQPQPQQTADIFGPSDEEKAAAAAAAQREQTQDANIATLNQRASDIEDQIRKLTGEIEVLNHRLDEIDQRMDRMKKDFDYKLCTMTAQQLGAQAGAGQPNAIPCGGDTQNGAPPAANVPPPQQGAQNVPPPPTGVTRLAPPPGVLGTLPQQDAANAPQAQPEAAPPPAQMAANDTHAQFEIAMNLLAKQQYDAASASFRTFADSNPKDALAPQALYWIGDIAYVQKDYQSAAHAFAESLKKYPASTRAPESMLKLGQALIAMNQKDEGCTTLRALPERYHSASKTVINEAEAVRRAGGCRR